MCYRRPNHFKRLYKIGFTPDDKVDPYKYFGDDIDSEKELGFFSVKQYALLFENKWKNR